MLDILLHTTVVKSGPAARTSSRVNGPVPYRLLTRVTHAIRKSKTTPSRSWLRSDPRVAEIAYGFHQKRLEVMELGLGRARRRRWRRDPRRRDFPESRFAKAMPK